MTASSIALDALVIDLLSDEAVVDAVAQFVAIERRVRAAYTQANGTHYVSQMAENAAWTGVRQTAAAARQDQAQLIARVGERMRCVAEDRCREEASA